MADANTKITVHNLADLKNTSDDAIPNYLNSLKFRQSHALSDVRLVLGYSAFALCAACFYWDYKFGWDATKHYTAVAVALYTLLNGALTAWIWLVEKGKVYVGTSPSGDKIEISTAVTKHDPTYKLSITYHYASSPHIPHTSHISRPFAQWFDASGKFVALPFQNMLAGEVPVIGKAESSKVLGVEPLKATAMQETVEAAASVASGSAVSGGRTENRRRV